MNTARRFSFWLAAAVVASWLSSAGASAERRFPPPQFDTPHAIPKPTTPAPDALWQDVLDVGLLALALVIGAWLVLRRRSRRGVFALAAVCLFYFGFVREGCVCSIGAIQNVSLALSDPGYALPWVVGAFFLLPIVFTLFFGRIFCAGVCPLGAIQDVVSWRPVRLPLWLEHALRLIAYAYLGLAILFAATGSAFVICEYDPFVAMFRLSGETSMLLFGAGLLLLGLFVVRPYCRFLCPYGVVLGWLSPSARHKPRIDPVGCINCHLCRDACPVNAIDPPEPVDPDAAVDRSGERRRMALLVMAIPVLIVLGGAVGGVSSERLSRMHRDVGLSERIVAEETGVVSDRTDASNAYRQTGRPLSELRSDGDAVRARFAIGAPLFGGFMGLVVGLKLISLARRRHRGEYDIAQSRCVACARCFEFCPHHPPNLISLETSAATAGDEP